MAAEQCVRLSWQRNSRSPKSRTFKKRCSDVLYLKPFNGPLKPFCRLEMDFLTETRILIHVLPRTYVEIIKFNLLYPLTPREFAKYGNLKPLMPFLIAVKANCWQTAQNVIRNMKTKLPFRSGSNKSTFGFGHAHKAKF